jgi:putative ABC transport system substrate-binding protein
MKRREFITSLAGAAALLPRIACAQQQTTLPVIGFIYGGSAETDASFVPAFRKGLDESGYVEDQNVRIEYHWLDGHYDNLAPLLADLIRRKVAVIATPGTTIAAVAAKAATATIPIVFGVAGDPVRLGLVASISKPGGNATGINFFLQRLAAKRLRLLHDLIPNATRIAVLVNPANVSSTEPQLREVQEAAPILGLQIQTILNAATIDEIDAAFTIVQRERPDALFVGADPFFSSRHGQLALLAARERIPAVYAARNYVAAGGLMGYGTDITDTFYQVGLYTGKILNGEKPADLPVLQSTKFEFVINLQAARALGIEVPAGLLSIADEVIE